MAQRNRNTNDGYEFTRVMGPNDYKLDVEEITDAGIREIRQSRADGATQSDIAAKWGLSLYQVSMICNGVTRPDAGGPLTHYRKPKLLDEDIKKMRERRAAGENIGAISRDYNTSYSYTSAVLSGRERASAPGPITVEPQTSRVLTDQEVRDIRAKRADGARIVDLSDEYQTTSAYISAICTGRSRQLAGGPITLGERGTTPPPEVPNVIRKLSVQGVTPEVIAEAFGYTPEYVRDVCKGKISKNTAGPRSRFGRRIIDAEAAAEIRSDSGKGYTVDELSEKYGVNITVIKDIIDRVAFPDDDPESLKETYKEIMG